MQFVPGASGLAKMAHLSEFQRAQLLRELSALEADNDMIIVDCGAGIGPDVLHFASAADNVLVVTAPEPTAITDAYALIKVLDADALHRAGEPAGELRGRPAGGPRRPTSGSPTVARQFLGMKVWTPATS